MSASDNLSLVKLYGRATPEEQAEIQKLLGIKDAPTKKSLKNVPLGTVLAAIEMLEKYKGPDQTTSATRMTLEHEASLRWKQHLDTLAEKSVENLVAIARDLTRVDNIGTGEGQVHWNDTYSRMELYIYLMKLARLDPFEDEFNQIVATVCRVEHQEWAKLSEAMKKRKAEKKRLELVKTKVEEWKATYKVTEDEMSLLGELLLAQKRSYHAFVNMMLSLPPGHVFRMQELIITLSLEKWKDAK